MNEKEKEIKRILDAGKKEIVKNAQLLQSYHLEKTGINTCISCPSSMYFMINNLKHLLNMTQFRLKDEMYRKFVWGGHYTIQNDTLTDDQAIAFLTEKPERIDLFSKFPSNWKDLISGKVETAEEREARLAAEGEAEAVKDSQQPEKENDELTEEDLRTKKLSELRLLFPDIKATSVDAFVKKVMAADK